MKSLLFLLSITLQPVLLLSLHKTDFAEQSLQLQWGIPEKVLNQRHPSDLAMGLSDLGSRLHCSGLLQTTALLILLWTGEEWPESKFLWALGLAPKTKIKDRNHRSRLQDAFKWRILLSGRNLHSKNVKSQVHKAAYEGGQGGHFLQKNSLELCNRMHNLRSPTHHIPFQTWKLTSPSSQHEVWVCQRQRNVCECT